MLSQVSDRLKITWLGVLVWTLIVMSALPAVGSFLPTLVKVNNEIVKSFQIAEK